MDASLREIVEAFNEFRRLVHERSSWSWRRIECGFAALLELAVRAREEKLSPVSEPCFHYSVVDRVAKTICTDLAREYQGVECAVGYGILREISIHILAAFRSLDLNPVHWKGRYCWEIKGDLETLRVLRDIALDSALKFIKRDYIYGVSSLGRELGLDVAEDYRVGIYSADVAWLVCSSKDRCIPIALFEALPSELVGNEVAEPFIARKVSSLRSAAPVFVVVDKPESAPKALTELSNVTIISRDEIEKCRPLASSPLIKSVISVLKRKAVSTSPANLHV